MSGNPVLDIPAVNFQTDWRCYKIATKIDSHKTTGPDDIPANFL